ncbi:MAG: hypothetical protein HC773_08860 [Scytonema sp. CRU_2_7]|nr:hypothetical protein [Scytonema sp. CRU_2_7]
MSLLYRTCYLAGIAHSFGCQSHSDAMRLRGALCAITYLKLKAIALHSTALSLIAPMFPKPIKKRSLFSSPKQFPSDRPWRALCAITLLIIPLCRLGLPSGNPTPGTQGDRSIHHPTNLQVIAHLEFKAIALFITQPIYNAMAHLKLKVIAPMFPKPNHKAITTFSWANALLIIPICRLG